MKMTQVIDKPCEGCGETERLHYAKGLCRNCYMNKYTKAKRNKDKETVGDN